MNDELLEVYARDSNYTIVKAPGRNYPGCVIQGDSLGALCRLTQSIANFVVDAKIDDEDLLCDVEQLNNSLVARMLHYQNVLTKHDIDFPHVHPFGKDDLVHLVQNESE